MFYSLLCFLHVEMCGPQNPIPSRQQQQPLSSQADGWHVKAQSGLCHHPSLSSCLIWNLLSKEPWKYFYESSTATNSVQLCVFAEKSFFHGLNTHCNAVLVDSRLLSCPDLIYLERAKLRNMMGWMEVKGKVMDWFRKQKLSSLSCLFENKPCKMYCEEEVGRGSC